MLVICLRQIWTELKPFQSLYSSKKICKPKVVDRIALCFHFSNAGCFLMLLQMTLLRTIHVLPPCPVRLPRIRPFSISNAWSIMTILGNSIALYQKLRSTRNRTVPAWNHKQSASRSSHPLYRPHLFLWNDFYEISI